MKIYRQHNCASKHRSQRTFLRCAVRRLEWVYGRGSYALIAWCKVPTIYLYESAQDAQQPMEQINSTGCGGRCARRHELVYVDLDGQVSR